MEYRVASLRAGRFISRSLRDINQLPLRRTLLKSRRIRLMISRTFHLSRFSRSLRALLEIGDFARSQPHAGTGIGDAAAIG